MDEQPTVASGDDADPDDAGPVDRKDELPSVVEDESPASEIIDLPWDDDLPVALGEETVLSGHEKAEEDHGEPADTDLDTEDDDPADDTDSGSDGIADDEDFGYPGEDEVDDGHGGRRARPHRVDTWRSRTATGAIATAIAMGLQQVFEPEQRRPAAVAEAPSDPYDEDDPITVDYVPDDAPATTVHVKPWLLQKGE